MEPGPSGPQQGGVDSRSVRWRTDCGRRNPLQRTFRHILVGLPATTVSGAFYPPNPIDNQLIERVPREDRRRLLAQCVSVDLVLSQVLTIPDEDVSYVYSPIESFVSLLTVVSGEIGLEGEMVGREGMLGAHLSPLRDGGTSPRFGSRAGFGLALRGASVHR